MHPPCFRITPASSFYLMLVLLLLAPVSGALMLNDPSHLVAYCNWGFYLLLFLPMAVPMAVPCRRIGGLATM